MGRFIMSMGGLMAFNLEHEIKDTVQVLLLSPSGDAHAHDHGKAEAAHGDGMKHEPLLIVRVQDIEIPREAELKLPARSHQGPDGEPCWVFDLSKTIVTLKRHKRAPNAMNPGRTRRSPKPSERQDFQWVPSMREICGEAKLKKELTGETVTKRGALIARLDLVGSGGSLRADERSYDVDPSVWEFTKRGRTGTFQQYACDYTKLRIKTKKRERVVLQFHDLDRNPLGKLTFRAGGKRRCALTCHPVAKERVKANTARTARHFMAYFDICQVPCDSAVPRQVESGDSESSESWMDGVYPVKCMPSKFP